MPTLSEIAAWISAKAVWLGEQAALAWSKASPWLSAKMSWLAESTTWMSDYALETVNKMTSNEVSVMIGLLTIMVVALVLPGRSKASRRQYYRERDARYRHLQDI